MTGPLLDSPGVAQEAGEGLNELKPVSGADARESFYHGRPTSGWSLDQMRQCTSWQEVPSLTVCHLAPPCVGSLLWKTLKPGPA